MRDWDSHTLFMRAFGGAGAAVPDGVGPVALPAGWDDEDMEVITDGVRNFRIPWNALDDEDLLDALDLLEGKEEEEIQPIWDAVWDAAEARDSVAYSQSSSQARILHGYEVFYA